MLNDEFSVEFYKKEVINLDLEVKLPCVAPNYFIDYMKMVKYNFGK